MTTIPPPRYKVVERGRRLVVIDTQTGQPASQPERRATPVTKPMRTDGAKVLRTARFFDDKGPREIVLGPNRTGMLNGGVAVAMIVVVALVGLAISFPALLFAPVFVLAQPKVRRGARAAITLWLDSLDQAAG